MPFAPFATRNQILSWVAAAIVLGVGCRDGVVAPGGATPDARMARAVSSDVRVTSAKPDSGVQGTTLDVTISGSGFTSDAVAEWALKGVKDPAQVRTNSTRYVSSRALVANITIGASATIARWDVMVKSGPKTGIGTEMFAVKATGNVDSDPRVLITWDDQINVAAPGDPSDMKAAGITGDRRTSRGAAATSSEYQGNFCGVQGKVFWDYATRIGSGDLVFDPDKEYSNNMSTLCGSARALNFYLGYSSGGSPGLATRIGAWTNANGVIALALGESRSQRLRYWYIGLRNCDRLDFDATFGSSTANVRVTRLADGASADARPTRRWRVESAHPHLAMCTISQGGQTVAKGTKYLPFAYTATEVLHPYSTYP